MGKKITGKHFISFLIYLLIISHLQSLTLNYFSCVHLHGKEWCLREARGFVSEEILVFLARTSTSLELVLKKKFWVDLEVHVLS
jgi:hypothetical protein